MIKYIETGDPADCYGCRACEIVCSHAAITIEENEEGFLYPVLNNEKCIACGLCSNICPVTKDCYNIHEQNAFCCSNQNQEIRLKSSSGGIFSLIAEKIIEKGGVVFGPAFDSGFNLKHISTDNCSGLDVLRGSKYLQSDTTDSYAKVKDILLKGKWVYYTGTPCQIAGLKNFLKKDFPNLLTSDLVCHGVPSNKLFNIYVDSLQKERGKISSFRFRNKEKFGWGTYYSFIWTDNGKSREKIFHSSMSPYGYFFDRGASYRECCYSCKFATGKRVGDITLADCWGVKKVYPDLDFKNGLSLIITNNQKGRHIIDSLKGLSLLPVEMSFAVDNNHNLKEPTYRPLLRNKIYVDLSTKSIDKLYEQEHSFVDKIKLLAKVWGIYLLRATGLRK